ncbi:MAG: hypothetical protein WBB74_11035 [Gaiellaceae bacterium]
METPELGTGRPVVEPEQWLAEQAQRPDALEASLADGSVRLLLLPGHVSSHAALEVLIGERDGDDLPWHPADWLETQDAWWIRRDAIVALRIVSGGKPTVETA